jgi:hypothetical protein
MNKRVLEMAYRNIAETLWLIPKIKKTIDWSYFKEYRRRLNEFGNDKGEKHGYQRLD